MIIKGGAKMSKSLGNVVSPDEMVEHYGADATRMYTLFATSPDRELDWQDEGVEGIERFLSRVYRLVSKRAASVASENAPRDVWEQRLMMEGAVGIERGLQRKVFQTVKRVTDDFKGRWHFNTSISAIMELVNELYLALEQEIYEKDSKIENRPAGKLVQESRPCFPRVDADFLRGVLAYLALLLAPFAPYLAHELWEMLGEKVSLLRALWPKYDRALAKEDEVEIPVQINGKLRSRIVVPPDTPENDVRARAQADEKIGTMIAGKQIAKVIVVPGKLVNIVLR